MKKYLIDVYIVDDHQMVCEGLTELINNSGKAHVSRSFNTLEACKTGVPTCSCSTFRCQMETE